MNYFEFIKTLKSDPYNQHPDFIKARNEDARCRQAYQQAMQQEQVLINALNIPVPSGNVEHIKLKQSQFQQRKNRNNYWSVAASLIFLLGVGWFISSINQNSDLEKFIHEALLMEPAVYMSESEIPQDQLQPLFASINTAVDGKLGRVHFMKLCPTLNGKGARMVLMNEWNQPITVLYMPNSPVENTIDMQMEGFSGKVIALEQGSAAIISRPHESTAQVEHQLQTALKPMN